jgi:hypothetical protein
MNPDDRKSFWSRIAAVSGELVDETASCHTRAEVVPTVADARRIAANLYALEGVATAVRMAIEDFCDGRYSRAERSLFAAERAVNNLTAITDERLREEAREASSRAAILVTTYGIGSFGGVMPALDSTSW